MGGSFKKLGEHMGVIRPKTKGYGGPRNVSTKYSSMGDGVVRLDPSIRRLQDEGLNRTNAIYGDVGNATSRYLTNMGSLRDSFTGNQNAYMKARINPVLEKFSSLRGKVQQDMGLRGIGGSSFGYGTMRDIESQASREEADARALAERESFDALSSINQNEISAAFANAQTLAGLNSENYDVAKSRLAEELSALGLGKEQISQAVGIWDAQSNRDQKAYDQMMTSWFKHNETAQNWMKTIGGAGGGGAG